MEEKVKQKGGKQLRSDFTKLSRTEALLEIISNQLQLSNLQHETERSTSASVFEEMAKLQSLIADERAQLRMDD
jgi:hypothetical protein